MHQVGAGVLGPVFRGYDPQDDRAVAIKAFSLDLTPEQASEFAADLGRLPTLPLGHPSIIAPLGAGADGATAYLVEEYFVAESADVALKQYGPAPVPDAMRLLGQLAGALDFAAASGVHHGALHPRDILVAPHEVRLTGLGVVAALERVGFRSPARRPYTAPELTSGNPVSAAADVFSLACVAFELVTGRRPALSGDSVTADTASIQAADVVALAEVFARALSPRPEDRYPQALAFAAALKHALTGDPLQAAVEPERPRPRRAGKGARKTPPLAAPLAAEAQADVPAELALQDARLEDVLPEPMSELSSEPAPGSTPLPSFLEAYQAAAPEEAPQDATQDTPENVPQDATRDAKPHAFPSDFRDEPTMEIPETAPPQPPAPQPPVPRLPDPLPLRLESPGEELPMFASMSPPAAGNTERRLGLVPLLGMLLLGIVLGFPAGYLVAPRSHPATPIAPAASTSRPQVQPAPVPPPPGAAQAEPPAQAIQAPGQPPARTGAGSGSAPIAGPATTDNPERMTARERRLARSRARRDATRAAIAKGGAGTAAVGQKAGPARTGNTFEGILVIASKPTGASVMLDGHPVGTTPLTLPTMSAGSHVVRLELTGYAVWSSSVQVTAGTQNRVTASLERRPPG